MPDRVLLSEPAYKYGGPELRRCRRNRLLVNRAEPPICGVSPVQSGCTDRYFCARYAGFNGSWPQASILRDTTRVVQVDFRAGARVFVRRRSVAGHPRLVGNEISIG